MIHVENLSYSVGQFRLQGVSLHVPREEYFVLLGPPGAGKTVFLECLCGLKRVSSGRITIDGRDVTHLEPRSRGIGYVPQDFALFDNKSVFENVCFGLRLQRRSRKDLRRRVDETAELLGITHLLDRAVPGLSGGEKQRVALGRALIVRPHVLLLDEPVSALDEATRERLCLELVDIQSRTGTTTIHVCHNFDEMRTVADRVALLRDGVVVQVGTPEELLNDPVDEESARFVRTDNILSAEARPEGEGSTLSLLGTVLKVPGTYDGEVRVGIRPENIQLRAADTPVPPGRAAGVGTVQHVSDRGALMRLLVRATAETELVVLTPKAQLAGMNWTKGSPVQWSLKPEAVHVFPSRDEA